MGPVQHHAAGALQIFFLSLAMSQIHDAGHVKHPRTHDVFQYFIAPFRATVRRQQRIQRDGAVAMKTHPVVGENGVRLPRLCVVGAHQHFHAGPFQGNRRGIEFLQHGRLRRLVLAGLRVLLEGIAAGCLRIEPKIRGPHHQHGPGTL